MNTLDKIRRAVIAHVPGSALHLAKNKRLLEKQLRADGWSRAAAVAEVSRRFNGTIAPVNTSWHNMPVPLEQDVQSASSLKPVPGALAGSRPHET